MESDSPYSDLVKKIRPQGSASARDHITKPPVLHIGRPARFYNQKLRILIFVAVDFTLLPFTVEIDGNNIGTLSAGETLKIPLEPGSHGLLMRMGFWYRSRRVIFEVKAGQRVRFVCHGRLTIPHIVFGLFFIYATLLPWRYIFLGRID